jgi:arylsulfatase A-like enzyme
VLITVDTLRLDELGAYGATGVETPNIDRLAKAGWTFDNAAAPLPETRPSHAALITARYPRETGVLSNRFTLSDEEVTVGEVFEGAGYRTGGFAGCVLLAADSGFAQGFARFTAPSDSPPIRPAPAVVDDVVAWLDEVDRRQPIFLWVHLFDPHMPYAPADGPAAGEELTWPQIMASAAAHGGDLPADVLARGRRLYRAEVASVDRAIGRLLERLERRGNWDKTVVLFTADHGECFANGIYFEHSNCLYDGAVHVPLLLRYPPRLEAGRRIAAETEHVDVAPTLLALAGLPRPGAFGERPDLMALAANEATPRWSYLEHPFYSAADARDRGRIVAELRSVAGDPTRPIVGGVEITGLRNRRFKYLLGDHEELYDLAADPGETADLAAAGEIDLGPFRNAVRDFRRRHPLRLEVPDQVDPELRRRLEALGYL